MDLIRKTLKAKGLCIIVLLRHFEAFNQICLVRFSVGVPGKSSALVLGKAECKDTDADAFNMFEGIRTCYQGGTSGAYVVDE